MKQLQNTLYILTPETYLFLQNEAIAVKVGGVEKVRVPAHTISSIFCFGNVTVSTPLIAFCGQRGISLVFLSEYGRFYGRIQGPVQGNILLRRLQFAALDDLVLSARLARSFLLGKLVNSKEFLLRARRERKEADDCFSPAIQKITAIANIIENHDEPRGVSHYICGSASASTPCVVWRGLPQRLISPRCRPC